jgi:hypothetical protein
MTDRAVRRLARRLEPENIQGLFGTILDKACEAQLQGAFFGLPQAWRWLAVEDGFALPAEARKRLSKGSAIVLYNPPK